MGVEKTLENKYGGNELFKGEFNKENQYKQNANNKKSVWLWGLGSHQRAWNCSLINLEP